MNKTNKPNNSTDFKSRYQELINENSKLKKELSIYKKLKDKEWKIIEKKVSESIRLMNLVAKGNSPYIKTTDSKHNKYVAPNLLKQNFYAEDKNQKWVTDITYISTNEGWLYLCVMIDLYFRMAIGWSMADNMQSKLVCNALQMAMFRRGMPINAVVHSDKRAQYCSENFQAKLTDHKLISSMSGKGCCYDSAACESFFWNT